MCTEILSRNLSTQNSVAKCGSRVLQHSTRLRALPSAGVTAASRPTFCLSFIAFCHLATVPAMANQQERRNLACHLYLFSSSMFLPRSTTRMLEERSRRELYVQNLLLSFFFFFFHFAGGVTARQPPSRPLTGRSSQASLETWIVFYRVSGP